MFCLIGWQNYIIGFVAGHNEGQRPVKMCMPSTCKI